MGNDRVEQILECVFEEESDTAMSCCSFKELECWSSLKYVHLVAVLEDTFGIELDSQQISLLTSFSGLCDVLAQHGVEIGRKDE